MELPETTKDITVEWLNHALHENGFLGRANIVSLRHEQIGVGRGFLSDIASLTLSYDRDAPRLPKAMVAKLPSAYKSAHEIAMRVLESEMRLYLEVAPKSPIRIPQLIYSGMDLGTQRYVLLMEDCSYATPGDGLQGLTDQQTGIAVSKIADFHARWWNGENQPSFPWIGSFKDLMKANVTAFRSSWDACTKIEGFREALPEGGWEAGLKIYEQRPWLTENLPEDNLTIIHGDFKADNMFFDWNTPENPLIVFDWGGARIGRGMNDLSRLLGSSLTTELRRQVEKDSVKLYHEHLVATGIADYTFDECWDDYLIGLLLHTRVFIGAFVNFDLSDPRASRAVATGLHRLLSAIVDNDATSILPG